MLAPLLQQQQGGEDADLLAALPDDELLALLLMAERRAGKRSFWWPYLRYAHCIVWSRERGLIDLVLTGTHHRFAYRSVIPEEYDTPLYWGEEERKHLAGTNVLLLAQVRLGIE